MIIDKDACANLWGHHNALGIVGTCYGFDQLCCIGGRREAACPRGSGWREKGPAGYRFGSLYRTRRGGRCWYRGCRIQRFADGPPPGLSSAINIFDFAEGEPSIAFTETDFAVVEVNEPDQVGRYIQSFEKAVDGALEPSDTAIYLRQLADQLE